MAISRQVHYDHIPCFTSGTVIVVLANGIKTAATTLEKAKHTINERHKRSSTTQSLYRIRICTIKPDGVANTVWRSDNSTKMPERFSPHYDTIIVMSPESYDLLVKTYPPGDETAITGIITGLKKIGLEDMVQLYRWPKHSQAALIPIGGDDS